MSISASTAINHPAVSHKIPVYVLDAQAALGNQKAAEPPAQPFDHASPPLREEETDTHEPKKKKRKREPKLDRAQIEEREHHAHVKPWLQACVEAAQRDMSDKQWSSYVMHTSTASATDQEADLASWSTRAAQIRLRLDMLSLCVHRITYFGAE